MKDWELAHVEFKSRRFVRRPDENHHEWAAALASLANRGGGYLIIGVDDATHAVEPGRFEDHDALAQQVANVNFSRCSPPTQIVHSFLDCGNGEVLVIEVGRRGPIPHAVVRRPGDRTYYIRNNQGKQFVTDTELGQMFSNVDFPDLRRRFAFVYFYQRAGLLEPYFPDLPPWSRNEVAFTTLIQQIGPVEKNDVQKVTRAIAEIFPYAVLSIIDRSFSAGWGRRIEPTGFGVSIQTGSEPTKVFTSEDVPLPPFDSILGRSIANFRELGKLLIFFDLMLPAGTEIAIQYVDTTIAHSSLVLWAKGVYKVTIRYRGGSWSVGLPPDHPHAYRVHPTVLQADDPHAWALGHVDLEFELEFGDYGPRARGDYYAWAKRVFDIVESQMSWAKYLERLPDAYTLGIARNVGEILRKLEAKDADTGS